MAKKTTALVAIGNAGDGGKDLGSLTAAIPTPPVFNAPAVAIEIKALNEQATRVFEGATRAVVDNDQAAAVGTDFLASIGARVKEVDAKRMVVTGQFDKLVKGLNGLYTAGPIAKLEEAKTLMISKLRGYQLKLRADAEAAAEVERQRIAAEAATNAATAVDEGDLRGAMEIIEDAAAVEVTAEKVEVRGATAVLATTKRKVGKVTSQRAFLYWLSETKTPMALAAMAGVSFGQRELNQLAAAVLTLREHAGDESISVPGFEAGYEESFGAR